MPRSKTKIGYGLKVDYIEFIHDQGIAMMWPGTEPVYKHDCIDENLLRSVAVQPFQSGFGIEFYPTLTDKAAYVFFTIAGSHIFSNGNKRTAVIALDQFLLANGAYLLLSNEEVKTLAELTASYHEREESPEIAKKRILDAITKHCIEFRQFRKTDPNVYRRMLRMRKVILDGDCVDRFEFEY